MGLIKYKSLYSNSVMSTNSYTYSPIFCAMLEEQVVWVT
jgi:hypothetical protein